MEDIIRDIQQKLQQNRFPNEASISQGIVLRLCRTLGWDVDDIDVVWPEYTIGSQRADFALCHPRGRAQVIIEVKQSGTLNGKAEEQLAAYAYQEGVPLVVLTSGQEWHFYAPYGPGKFSDRRIYRLDLLQRDPAEARARLERYLAFDNWTSGQANLSVQEDLKEMLSKQETRLELPKAWNALLAEPNSQLVELLAAQLEKQTGSEPPKGEIVAFLREKTGSYGDRAPKPQATASQNVTMPISSLGTEASGEIVEKTKQPSLPLLLRINGEEIPTKNQKDAFIRAMSYLVQQHPDLPSRFSSEALQGNRPTFARSPGELYPGSEHLANKRSNFAVLDGAPEWFMDVNLGRDNKIALVKRACRLVGDPDSVCLE